MWILLHIGRFFPIVLKNTDPFETGLPIQLSLFFCCSYFRSFSNRPTLATANYSPGGVTAAFAAYVSHMEKNAIDSKIALSGVMPFDLLLIVILLVLSTGLIIRSGFSGVRREAFGATAVVHRAGSEVMRIDLGSDGTFDLPGGRVRIVSKEGRVRIARSDCPQNTCVHAGWIGSAGETLVCVPNQLVIEIVTDTEPEVDAVVF